MTVSPARSPSCVSSAASSADVRGERCDESRETPSSRSSSDSAGASAAHNGNSPLPLGGGGPTDPAGLRSADANGDPDSSLRSLRVGSARSARCRSSEWRCVRLLQASAPDRALSRCGGAPLLRLCLQSHAGLPVPECRDVPAITGRRLGAGARADAPGGGRRRAHRHCPVLPPEKIGKGNLALPAAAIYALNPISIYEVRLAHWDGLTALGMLAGLYALAAGRTKVSGVLSGLGALLKQFPLVLLPIAALKERNFRTIAWMTAVASVIVVAGFVAVSARLSRKTGREPLESPLVERQCAFRRRHRHREAAFRKARRAASRRSSGRALLFCCSGSRRSRRTRRRIFTLRAS